MVLVVDELEELVCVEVEEVETVDDDVVVLLELVLVEVVLVVLDVVVVVEFTPTCQQKVKSSTSPY